MKTEAKPQRKKRNEPGERSPDLQGGSCLRREKAASDSCQQGADPAPAVGPSSSHEEHNPCHGTPQSDKGTVWCDREEQKQDPSNCV